MTIFTLFWGCVLIIAFINKDIIKMISVTLISMLFQATNMIDIGESGIGPQVVASLLFIIKYLWWTKGKIRIIKSGEIQVIDLLFVLFVIIIVISSYANGVLERNSILIIKLFIYLCCYLCMRGTLGNIDATKIYNMMRPIIIFSITIGIIQWIVTNYIPFFRPIMKVLFYNDSSLNVYFNYNDSYHNRRIYSTFMEPSYFSCLLVGAFYYLLSFKSEYKKNIVLLCVILIEILLTTSSTAYLAFVIAGILFVIYSKQMKLKYKIIIIFISIMSLLILYFGFYNLLDKVIFSKSSSGSGVTRTRWNLEALEAFYSSPIIGVGYKNIRGSSIICSILGEVGLSGLICYVLIIFACTRKFFKKNKYKNVSDDYYGVMLAVLTSVICQIVACPDFDLCTFWFWMYALGIYEGLYVNNFLRRRL